MRYEVLQHHEQVAQNEYIPVLESETWGPHRVGGVPWQLSRTPARMVATRAHGAEEQVAPRDDTELALAEEWKTVLGRDRVDPPGKGGLVARIAGGIGGLHTERMRAVAEPSAVLHEDPVAIGIDVQAWRSAASTASAVSSNACSFCWSRVSVSASLDRSSSMVCCCRWMICHISSSVGVCAWSASGVAVAAAVMKMPNPRLIRLLLSAATVLLPFDFVLY